MFDTDTLRLLAFVGGLGLFFLVETLFAARPWDEPRRQRLGMHAIITVINSVLVRLLALLPFLWWADVVSGNGWGLVPWLGLQGIPEIILTVIVFDMFDYWWHRFNHRVDFLWRFHKVHHVDTHVDVTTALRFHPGELVVSYAFKALWILVWGPSLWAFVIFEASVTLAAQFHHSNIRFPAKWEKQLRKIIVTPEFHTAHHTVTPRTGNANFSTIFIFWDHLFGTYREPDEEEMKTLGLPEGRDSYLSFREWFTAPFRKTNQASNVVVSDGERVTKADSEAD